LAAAHQYLAFPAVLDMFLHLGLSDLGGSQPKEKLLQEFNKTRKLAFLDKTEEHIISPLLVCH
jgi:hypothetical protein